MTEGPETEILERIARALERMDRNIATAVDFLGQEIECQRQIGRRQYVDPAAVPPADPSLWETDPESDPLAAEAATAEGAGQTEAEAKAKAQADEDRAREDEAHSTSGPEGEP